MKIFKYISCFSLIICLLSSCGPTYPKENLINEIKQLVYKESGRICEVYQIDSTVFLDMPMDELTSTNNETIGKAIKSLQNAVFAITRVALSSDADVKILVISAFDPNYQVLLRMFQNIDDVKAYFFQKISRGDYEKRQLIEFEGPNTTRETVLDKHHVTQEEYIARLIISQINMSAKTNPFLSALIPSLNLRYEKIDNGSIYISSRIVNPKGIDKVINSIIADKLNEYIKKYEIFSVKSAIILLDNKDIGFEILVNGVS